MDYKKMYYDLLTEYEQSKRESIRWMAEDFMDLEDDYDITREQAQDALEAMIMNHDANYGITWETVQQYKSRYGTRREKP